MLQILEKPVSGIYFHTIWWHALIWVKKLLYQGKELEKMYKKGVEAQPKVQNHGI